MSFGFPARQRAALARSAANTGVSASGGASGSGVTRRAQELYRAHVKRPGTVDNFLVERREEAGREEREPADRERKTS